MPPGKSATDFLDATRLATALLGDSIATNPFMLGFAYQKGLIPVSARLAGAGHRAERRGRRGQQARLPLGPARRPRSGRRRALRRPDRRRRASRHADRHGLDEIVAKRVDFLTGYQDAAYAERYRALVERVRAAEAERAPGMTGLAEAVARYYFKLLAYKDEYEVARLYTDGTFPRSAEGAVRGRLQACEFHLSPPLLAPRDPDNGQPVKRAMGPGCSAPSV